MLRLQLNRGQQFSSRSLRAKSYDCCMSWSTAVRRGDGDPEKRMHMRVQNAPDGSKDIVTSATPPDIHEDLEQAAPLLRKATSRTAKFQIAGQDLSPELIAISLVYFVQGTLGLSRLALSFFLKDTLHIDPAQSALLTGFGSAPWMIKPLYGFISDSIPLFGYRRRSYLVGCGLLGTVSWAALATVVDSPSAALAAMVLGSLSTAFSDVVVDSLVVERARGEPQSTSGALQSLCWGSAAVGGIASAYFSGSLVEDYGTRWVFGLTALFPLIVSASALLIDEKPAVRNPHKDADIKAGLSRMQVTANDVMRQGRALIGAVGQRHILLPVVFVFLWQSTPSAESALFYFQTNQLHFTPEFLGRVRLVASIASLIGVATYNGLLKGVELRRILLWMMVLGTLLSSTQLLLVSGANRSLGISDQAFALCDSAVLTVLGQISFMPILVLAARLCPEGVEATLFATLMSILNLGAAASGLLGAALTQQLGVTADEFGGLFMLVAICSASTMLPAPFLFMLPSDKEEKHKGEKHEQQGRKD